MKDKIKKFYDDHKSEVILVGLMVLAGTAGVAYHKHAMDGMDVPGLMEYTTEDGEQILVMHRKNGSVKTFRRNPEK